MNVSGNRSVAQRRYAVIEAVDPGIQVAGGYEGFELLAGDLQMRTRQYRFRFRASCQHIALGEETIENDTRWIVGQELVAPSKLRDRLLDLARCLARGCPGIDRDAALKLAPRGH